MDKSKEKRRQQHRPGGAAGDPLQELLEPFENPLLAESSLSYRPTNPNSAATSADSMHVSIGSRQSDTSYEQAENLTEEELAGLTEYELAVLQEGMTEALSIKGGTKSKKGEKKKKKK